MTDTKNLRVALLAGGAANWREAVTPLLLAQTDCLVLAETAAELLLLDSCARPELIFLCHHPENGQPVADAERIRSAWGAIPLVLVAQESVETLKGALALGALGILEPPFSEASFLAAFEPCRRLALALRRDQALELRNRSLAQLFMESPCYQLFVDADGMVPLLSQEMTRITGLDQGYAGEFSQISRRFFAPHAATYPRELEAAVQSGTNWRGTLSGRPASGATRSYLAICRPLHLPQAGPGMLVTLQDLTEDHAARAQLKKEGRWKKPLRVKS